MFLPQDAKPEGEGNEYIKLKVVGQVSAGVCVRAGVCAGAAAGCGVCRQAGERQGRAGRGGAWGGGRRAAGTCWRPPRGSGPHTPMHE